MSFVTIWLASFLSRCYLMSNSSGFCSYIHLFEGFQTPYQKAERRKGVIVRQTFAQMLEYYNKSVWRIKYLYLIVITLLLERSRVTVFLGSLGNSTNSFPAQRTTTNAKSLPFLISEISILCSSLECFIVVIWLMVQVQFWGHDGKTSSV